jgi:hypothetical protein
MKLEEVREKAKKLLDEVDTVELEGLEEETGEHFIRKVAFVDKETLDKILLLDSAAQHLKDESRNRAKDPMYDIWSIRNADNPIFRSRKSLYIKVRSNTVTNQDKIKEKIPGEFIKWQRTKKKDLREYFENNPDFSEEYRLKKTNELNELIAQKEIEVADKMENFHLNKFQISSYKQNNHKAYLYCNFHNPIDKKGSKAKYEYLREDVPNIIYIKDKKSDKDTIRASANVLMFLEGATNLFGDVYYKKK